ncbi:hypothetical protein DCAR_0207701 [Daucus carota subsp. sativus]|uniref:Agenet-like domain-containing protein n=1 Tax=Daucus carota subsp. sativus TaxID=79200 RepID=A0AAF0WH56_DAUCS|nr:hypothetical protein DCAR_0207701 [Daucus carota subsp. sativus]
MDYDNNEFEAHSHKLSGEECSKVSSVLHPYALPKFDFDDNLQNHLRFDSLVENEVFLGILSQEDNHWIEDFSRGSSGIEFNSSAAESCSVSRRNNVWFEATSSESVEMLLKSIGQEEEAALGEAVIEESDAVIKVGTLEKEMDPILNKQDEVVDNTLPQHELLPYSVTDNLEDSALPEHANALFTSEPQRDGFCNSLCSAEVESNVDVVLVNAEKLKDDLKSGDAKGVINENLTNKSPTENMKEASSVSAVHMEMLKIENANSVSHNAIVNSGELEKQVITVFAESVDALPTGNIAGNKVEVSITTSEVPSGTPIKVGDHSNMLVDFEDNLSAAARHTKLLNCSPCEDAPVVCSSDNNPNEKVVEVSNTQAVASACPELDMGSVEEKDCGSQAVSTESPNVGNPNSQIESSLCEVSPVVCSNEYKPNEKVVEVSNTQAVASDCPELELGSVEEKDLGSLVVNLEVQNIGIHSSETETSSCPDLKMDLAVENDSFAGSSHQMGSHVLAEATVSGDNDPGYTQHTGITEDVGVDLSSLSTPLTSGEREQPLDGNMTPEGCRSPPTLGKSVNPKEKDLPSCVNTCNAGRSDQAAAEAGTECSEKQEVCSVSVDSTVKQVDGTAAAEFQKGKEIPMEKIAETSLKEVPVYGSDSMVEDCGHPLNVKETTIDSFQHIELSGAVGTDMSVPLNSEIEATGGQSSFSFDVFPSNSPSKGQISKDCQSFPSIQVSKGPLLTSNSDQADLKTATEFSCITPQAPGVGKVDVSVKGTPKPKTRRASGKASVRSAKKGSNLKEATPGRQSDKKENSPSFMQTPRTGQPGQFKELKPCGDVTKSGTKPLAFLPIPTSNLPDLNTSVPTAAGFQQPFTDLQQVQLRAQIFVYGSLIQESAPDEACMISAFGPSDGGGDVWGSAWRACVERAHARKSSASNMGTPVQSFSGGKAPIQPFKHSILQNKPLPSPAGRASSELISSPAVTPIIPLSSPLWNVSTPSCDGLQSSGMLRGGLVDCYQPHSPLHPFQVPGTRNFVWHSPSWPSQGPFSSSWMATSQTSASDANVRFSVFPNTEPVKLTPAKYSSVPSFPAMKIASVPVPNDSCVAAVSTGASSQPSVSNPRKRKNSPASEAVGNIPLLGLNQGASVWHPSVNNQLTSVPEIVGQTLLLPQSRTDSVQTAAVSAVFSTSVAVTAPDHFNFGNSSGNILGNQPNRVGKNVERSCIPVQISSTVEEAKLHAETAAAHAANAVGHYHDFWSELDKQKNLGVISDVEAKLASSAAAITAATSVARAAAAAAMIASNVAVQAKLMADEVSSSSVIVDPTHSNSSSKATSAGGERREGSVHPSSIIAVAREAAKKRVEAASAASKHAENLDAIVKAAELAAEAVSQAGKILSVGGTLPLSALKEIVPAASEQGANKHIVNCDQPKAFSIELFNFSAEESKRGSSAMEAMKTGKLPSQEKESSKAQRGGRESKLTKTHVIAEAEAGSRCVSGFVDAASAANAAESLIENVMEEGCLVEVFKDCGNGKAAWYSANILSLKDGKAFLSYTDLQAEDGKSRKLEDSRLLPICENEKEFNVGKNTVLANKQEKRRIARTGLKKEGSRVVFGVPTPGKKRKFMDVSKHIDSDKSSTIMKTDDPVKYARNVAPQVSGFRGWKSSTKDNKDKQAAEDKPKVLRSGKPPSASNRTLPRKDNILTSNRSMPRDASATDRTSGDAISNEETCTSQENLMEFGSVSDSQDTSEGQTLASSLGFSRVPSKKGSSSNSRSERRNKGKYVPHAGRNSKKDELEEKLVHEVVEPRRSNRKIQPTSRLLEGLQSSLSIPKMPFSHDKSYRSQSRIHGL